MIEMELKATLTNRSEVIKNLEQHGCKWIETVLQEDTIYIKSDIDQNIHEPIFRIRKCEDKTILTLKVLENDIHTAKELELNISNEKIMDQILKTIGFYPHARVMKKRSTTTLRGFNICIDEVKGLGNFIEVETISNLSDNKKNTYKEMLNVLLELGVEKQNLLQEKYYEMLLKKERKR